MTKEKEVQQTSYSEEELLTLIAIIIIEHILKIETGTQQNSNWEKATISNLNPSSGRESNP